MANSEWFDDNLLNILRELGEDIPTIDRQEPHEDHDSEEFRNGLENPPGLSSTRKTRLSDMTDGELKSLPIIELNQMLRECQDTVAQEIRRRRRCLKNREYALSARQKRVKEQEQLQRENDKLKAQLSDAQEEQARIIAERDMYRRRGEVLAAAWSRLSECVAQANCDRSDVN